MSYLKQFILPVKGMGLGRSSFGYEIGKTFFEQFENSEIEQAKIHLNLDVNKQSRMLVLDFKISGTILTQCDRCLYDFNLEINNKQTLYVKLGNESDQENDEMMIISESEHELNIAQFVFEFIYLSLPIKKVHYEDKNGNSLCNKEMLKKLSSHQAEEEKQIDPRWNKLKDLM